MEYPSVKCRVTVGLFLFLVTLITSSYGAPVKIPPFVQKIVYNVSDRSNLYWDPSAEQRNKSYNVKCHLKPVDAGLHDLVTLIIARKAKLIDYSINITGNYTVNPLLVNQTWTYKGDKWARVGSSHGQTILNLAFNYGILSLMTLTFGIEKLNVELEEIPYGCLSTLTEEEKVQAVSNILLRDLKEGGDVKVYEGESSICHQVIKEEDGMAKFTDRCCFEAREGKEIICVIDIPNEWLQTLDTLLAILTLMVFLFGPTKMPDWIYTATLDNIQYYVKLKEALYKTIVVSHRDEAHDIKAKHILNLRNRKDFEKCRRILGELPPEMVVPIKVNQFDITVSYKKLLQENKVPVGVISSLSRAIFLCKVKETKPFKPCCDAPVCGCCSKTETHKARPMQWKSLCSFLGRILFVIYLPMLFYMRLAVYYLFESPEIVSRQKAADQMGLDVYYNYRLMQYLTPLHPLYISAYIIYFVTGFIWAYLSGKTRRTHFQQAIIDAFKDMKNLSQLNVFGMLVVNCLWPFKKFGIFGILVGIFFWPIILPISIVACIIYSIPLVFISIRIVYNTFSGTNDKADFHQSMGQLQADTLFKKIGSKSNLKKAKEGICYSTIRLQKLIIHILLSSTALLSLYAMMLMIAEVASFLAEVMCFTMMGLIVNAAKVLKYGSLLFLMIIYSYDCYNNVNKKYLKLNKALFKEVQRRLGKDIEEFTQLPEEHQENRGFKSGEISDQAEYENIDDIHFPEEPTYNYHWAINDLILFIDKQDTPRIPKKLFDDVCAIKVAGSPGPVYASLIQATVKFMTLILFLIFVLIVVMSFGDSYQVSSTNQMLATMAGGFLPLILKTVLKPASADIEPSLLSFGSKVQEIVQNFWQPWPMDDFLFEVEEEPKSESEEEEEEEEDDDDAYSEARTEVTVVSDKTAKTDKSDDKKKKEKDEKKKDEKDDKANGMATFAKTTTIELASVKNQVECLELKPAEGKEVDILIYMSESDQEWIMEWSSITDLDKTEYDSVV